MCRTLSENPGLAGPVQTFRSYFWDDCLVDTELLQEVHFPNTEKAHLDGIIEPFLPLFSSTRLREIYVRLCWSTPALPPHLLQRHTGLRYLDLCRCVGGKADMPTIALPELHNLAAEFDLVRSILLGSPAVVELKVHLDRDVSEVAEFLRTRSPDIQKLEMDCMHTEISESNITSIQDLPQPRELHISCIRNPEEKMIAILHDIVQACPKLNYLKWAAPCMDYERVTECVYRRTLVDGLWKDCFR
ncbi:hypothetical protein FRB95_003342 [Tulasnella sp. JGI-2019a]|nr:hypothetical protein FRB95_003342 [Tulasnella sp. JGI-2019a]